MAMGANTLLFAAFSPELKQKNGKYITAWGRFIKPRDDLIREMEAGGKVMDISSGNGVISRSLNIFEGFLFL
jgi:hypothetical protein